MVKTQTQIIATIEKSEAQGLIHDALNTSATHEVVWNFEVDQGITAAKTMTTDPAWAMTVLAGIADEFEVKIAIAVQPQKLEHGTRIKHRGAEYTITSKPFPGEFGVTPVDPNNDPAAETGNIILKDEIEEVL